MIEIAEYILLIGTLIMVLTANAFFIWLIIQEIKENKKEKKGGTR